MTSRREPRTRNTLKKQWALPAQLGRLGWQLQYVPWCRGKRRCSVEHPPGGNASGHGITTVGACWAPPQRPSQWASVYPRWVRCSPHPLRPRRSCRKVSAGTGRGLPPAAWGQAGWRGARPRLRCTNAAVGRALTRALCVLPPLPTPASRDGGGAETGALHGPDLLLLTPHPPAPGLAGVFPRLGVSGPGRGCARPLCLRPGPPCRRTLAAAPPACPSRFALCLAACYTYLLPFRGPPPLTEPVSLFSLSSLSLSLRTHALRLPGLAMAPRVGALVSQAQPALTPPACSFSPLAPSLSSVTFQLPGISEYAHLLPWHPTIRVLLRAPFVSLWWMWPRFPVCGGT